MTTVASEIEQKAQAAKAAARKLATLSTEVKNARPQRASPAR